jgi:hypothetical protein
MNNPKRDDDLEKAYRDSLLSDAADKLEERLIRQNGERFYADLVDAAYPWYTDVKYVGESCL